MSNSGASIDGVYGYLTAHPLFVVGDDAADKVGVGVPQSCHELRQLLLVQLAHCAKHALLGLVGSAKRCLIHSRDLVQTHNSVD